MTKPPDTAWVDFGIWVSLAATAGAVIFAVCKLRHSDSYLAGWGAYFTALATFALVIGALVAARTAIQELGEKRNFERARWLSDLYRSHYEEKKFKCIRARIDYNDLDDIRTIIGKDLKDRDKAAREKTPPKSSLTLEQKLLLDKLTDYFNFFEMIGYLCKLEVISPDDVKALFQYYLEQLARVDPDFQIRRYLSQVGFEYLFTHLEVKSQMTNQRRDQDQAFFNL